MDGALTRNAASPTATGGGTAELSYEGREASNAPADPMAAAEMPDPNVDAEWRTILGRYKVLRLETD